jgi:hypothetical protein
MREIWKNVLLLGGLVVGVHPAQAQMATQAAKPPTFNSGTPAKQSTPPPSSAKPTLSPHILERSGPPPDEVNRKEFEENAGEKAGKLLLRSVPDGADIFVNDLLVGRTPLLMVIAPGQYKVAMRGTRDDLGHASVGVMPKETHTITIDLKQRYPASISLR